MKKLPQNAGIGRNPQASDRSTLGASIAF